MQEFPVALVTDNGLTEFNGVLTDTAIAVGPAPAEFIDKITGAAGVYGSKLKLL